MAKLPLHDEIIDLSLSKHTNKNRIFTLKTLLDIEKLGPERSSVLMFALSKTQQLQYDSYILNMRKASIGPDSDVSSFGTIDKLTIYSSGFRALIVKGKYYSFEESVNAQGLLAVIFRYPERMAEPLAYIDFIDEYAEDLRAYDLLTVNKIKSTKSLVNKKVKDFFPLHGLLVINPEYI